MRSTLALSMPTQRRPPPRRPFSSLLDRQVTTTHRTAYSTQVPTWTEIAPGVWWDGKDRRLPSSAHPVVQAYLIQARTSLKLPIPPSDVVYALAALDVFYKLQDPAHWLFWKDDKKLYTSAIVNRIALHSPPIIRSGVAWNGTPEYLYILSRHHATSIRHLWEDEDWYPIVVPRKSNTPVKMSLRKRKAGPGALREHSLGPAPDEMDEADMLPPPPKRQRTQHSAGLLQSAHDVDVDQIQNTDLADSSPPLPSTSRPEPVSADEEQPISIPAEPRRPVRQRAASPASRNQRPSPPIRNQRPASPPPRNQRPSPPVRNQRAASPPARGKPSIRNQRAASPAPGSTSSAPESVSPAPGPPSSRGSSSSPSEDQPAPTHPRSHSRNRSTSYASAETLVARRSLSVLSAETVTEGVDASVSGKGKDKEKEKTRSSGVNLNNKNGHLDLNPHPRLGVGVAVGVDGETDKPDDAKTDASGESEGMVTRGRASKARRGSVATGVRTESVAAKPRVESLMAKARIEVVGRDEAILETLPPRNRKLRAARV